MPATTPKRLFPYPVGTDPIDTAGDVQRLAMAVDVDSADLRDPVVSYHARSYAGGPFPGVNGYVPFPTVDAIWGDGDTDMEYSPTPDPTMLCRRIGLYHISYAIKWSVSVLGYNRSWVQRNLDGTKNQEVTVATNTTQGLSSWGSVVMALGSGDGFLIGVDSNAATPIMSAEVKVNRIGGYTHVATADDVGVPGGFQP